MTPTSLFELLKNSQKAFDTELVEKYKRLDSGAIELTLKNGMRGVFSIAPRTKRKCLILEWN